MPKAPQPPKEPARLWIWATIGFLVFCCVPYFFAGSYEPLVFGVPLWFLTVLVASLALTGFTMYVVVRQWRLAETILGEEER
jgi:hypothetical protein